MFTQNRTYVLPCACWSICCNCGADSTLYFCIVCMFLSEAFVAYCCGYLNIIIFPQSCKSQKYYNLLENTTHIHVVFFKMQQLIYTAFTAPILPSLFVLFWLSAVRHLIISADCVWPILRVVLADCSKRFCRCGLWLFVNTSYRGNYTSLIMLMTFYCIYLIYVSPFLITEAKKDPKNFSLNHVSLITLVWKITLAVWAA